MFEVTFADSGFVHDVSVFADTLEAADVVFTLGTRGSTVVSSCRTFIDV